jgi:PncC family amidohydrolase
MDPAAIPSLDDLVAAARAVQTMAIERRRTVATAESCTGGLLAHVLTEIAGSSAYFLGGIVSYADDVKVGALGVPADVLAMHGAVSEPVAAAMAEGARARLGADLAASVTGIAGPGGGTPGKPVGLTFVAVADADGTTVLRRVWGGDRSANKRSSAAAALALLFERLSRAPSGPGDAP